MTELVRADHFAAALATVAKVNDLGPRLIDAERLGWREQAKIVEEAETLLAAVSVASEAIAEAGRPATRKEIAIALAKLLLRGWPNAGKADVEGFGELLAEDVTAARPSIAALVQGCAKVRRTSEYFPTIAKVLEAIREVDDGIRAAKLRLEAMPARMAELKRAVEEGQRMGPLR
jgi:hypothetical protein